MRGTAQFRGSLILYRLKKKMKNIPSAAHEFNTQTELKIKETKKLKALSL